MKKSPYLLIFLILIVLAASFLYIFREAINVELNKLKLVPQREAFTELYIKDFSTLSANLPSKIVPGTTVSFSFTIHNVEGHTMSYPYKVYVLSTNGNGTATTTVDRGQVELASDAFSTIAESYTFASSNTQTSFVIVLPQLNQSIQFFVPNKE
ncbi:DUF1616 domain-containing protein [Patescibacteria group bacterium]|nr:DUF1616 domain-containing protein [Patescibacteria group bacterium]